MSEENKTLGETVVDGIVGGIKGAVVGGAAGFAAGEVLNYLGTETVVRDAVNTAADTSVKEAVTRASNLDTMAWATEKGSEALKESTSVLGKATKEILDKMHNQAIYDGIAADGVAKVVASDAQVTHQVATDVGKAAASVLPTGLAVGGATAGAVAGTLIGAAAEKKAHGKYSARILAEREAQTPHYHTPA